MPEFTLRLSADEDVPDEEAATSFYWLTSTRSSFTAGVGPHLQMLGAVRPLNLDLVRIALAAFAADRSVLRAGEGSNWNQRVLHLRIPVSDPSAWKAVSDDLAAVMGFLSGDDWMLTFTADDSQAQGSSSAPTEDAPQRVVLLSGGADSATGALHSRSLLDPTQSHVLVSHFSNTMLAPIQRHIAAELERLVPGPAQRHVVVHLGRRSRRINGTAYPSESSSRSRSLLFLALALAVASVHEVPVWIPENGFASINPPLGRERLGSLSTRTTHPAFLDGLGAVLTRIGAHGHIENPFCGVTKGEMFQRVAAMIGAQEASAFLSATHSCSLTGQRAHGISAETQCGVCFGCVLRRASFSASGVTDHTAYIAPSPEAAVQRWLDSRSVEPAVRNFVRRGVRPRELTALGLPTSYPLSQAVQLCRRGIDELGSLYP